MSISHPLDRRCATAIVVLALVVGASQNANADPKREVPDYDGRGNRDADAGHWVLWIPRVALWPVYAINEYVFRRPSAAIISYVDRHHWVNSITDIFTFGPEGKNVILPTALFDFGLLPSVGVYFAGDDAFVNGNTIRLHAATWGLDWINVTGLERYTNKASGTVLAARVEFKRQADLLFLGTGPDVTNATRSRYGLQRFEARAAVAQRLSGESNLSLSSGFRTIGYRAGNCCGDPTLDARIADGTLMMPAGYGVAYNALFERADLILDTRAPRPASATGGYLQMHAETSFDVRNDRSWISYGGIFGITFDLHSRQRTVKVQVGADYTDPLQGDVVPFNELASPAGNLMPGFVAGWMSGRSTFAAQLGYSWPVWMYFDGQLRFSVGNAFGPHLDDLAANKLRLSGDLGFTSIGKRDQGVEVLIGVGTETLEQGAGITSVRLSLGSRKGF